MRWIKAKERLPDIQEGQQVYLKGYPRLDKGVIYKEYIASQKSYFIMVGREDEVLSQYRDGHEELENIFWLDEAESTGEQNQDLLWREVDQFIHDNWGNWYPKIKQSFLITRREQ